MFPSSSSSSSFSQRPGLSLKFSQLLAGFALDDAWLDDADILDVIHLLFGVRGQKAKVTHRDQGARWCLSCLSPIHLSCDACACACACFWMERVCEHDLSTHHHEPGVISVFFSPSCFFAVGLLQDVFHILQTPGLVKHVQQLAMDPKNTEMVRLLLHFFLRCCFFSAPF